MSTMTDSFRLADIDPLTFAPRMHWRDVGPSQTQRQSAGHRPSAAVAVLPANNVAGFPVLEAAVKAAQLLRRPAAVARTADEELLEERLNTITHGLGLAISAAGVVYLLASVVMVGGWLRIASCGVYGVSLVLMYAASTSLHAARQPGLKLRFQLFDHVAIYLLIAGTYTPFLASLMQGFVGFTLLASVWSLALAGIVIKVKNADRLGETSPLPCLGLGWLVLVALKPLMAAMPAAGIALLVAGGISYSIGMLFFCRDDKRYFHAIWHLFVIAGTVFHFCAVLLYVAG
jgi:hemolysin III